MNSSDTRISKVLSLVLRHRPEEVGIELDEEGWADVESLLAALSRSGTAVSRETLDRVVADNDKQRFTISEGRIRANQGHSVTVDLKFFPKAPPAVLYHGTGTRFLESIFREGIRAMSRHHVHLSRDVPTAARVGRRHGSVVVLEVDAANLHAAGREFYLSENGVWLTDWVPPEALTVAHAKLS